MGETGDDVSSTSGERKKDDDGMDEAEGLHAIQGEGKDIGGGQPSGRLDNEAEGKEETTTNEVEGCQGGDDNQFDIGRRRRHRATELTEKEERRIAHGTCHTAWGELDDKLYCRSRTKSSTVQYRQLQFKQARKFNKFT